MASERQRKAVDRAVIAALEKELAEYWVEWERERMTDRKLKLYKYTDGSVYYWVAAHSSKDVAALVGETEGVGSIEYEQFDVFRVSPHEGASTKLTGDGEPVSNMQLELSRATRPVVIGCSEWP